MVKTRVIMFKEKYNNRYFIFNSDEELRKIFLTILKERNKEGFFKHDYLHREKVYSLIKKGKSCEIQELKSFFNLRSDYEYERFQISEGEEY